MKTPPLYLFISGLWLIMATQMVTAENLFVTDQLKAGLHEEKSLDSPIVKIVPTGTSLEIVKQEESVSFVKEPGGASGWIDNSYLVEAKPAGSMQAGNPGKVQALETELEQAKQRIETLITQTGPSQENETLSSLRKEKEDAEQQYKSERIKVGELQVQLAELRKRLGQDNDTDTLYKKIDALTKENKQLEVQLARAEENISNSINEHQESGSVSAGTSTSSYWRNIFIAFLVILVLGIGLGIYIMDILNRRRHGGFRV